MRFGCLCQVKIPTNIPLQLYVHLIRHMTKETFHQPLFSYHSLSFIYLHRVSTTASNLMSFVNNVQVRYAIMACEGHTPRKQKIQNT